MNIRSLPIHAALKGKLQTRFYQPEDPDHTPEQGLDLLRRMALDAPVGIVTLERGWPAHQLRRVRHTELSLNRLLAGKTAYAAALEIDGRLLLVLVALSPLVQPAKPPQFFPPVPYDQWRRTWRSGVPHASTLPDR